MKHEPNWDGGREPAVLTLIVFLGALAWILGLAFFLF